LRHQKIEDK